MKWLKGVLRAVGRVALPVLRVVASAVLARTAEKLAEPRPAPPPAHDPADVPGTLRADLFGGLECSDSDPKA